MKFQWVSWSWLLASQPENGTRRWESASSKKELSVWFFPPVLSSISRIYHGRVVAMPGTRNAATQTTALQTPGTSPALWWNSGSKLWMNVWWEVGTLSRWNGFMMRSKKKNNNKRNLYGIAEIRGQQTKWPFFQPHEDQLVYWGTFICCNYWNIYFLKKLWSDKKVPQRSINGKKNKHMRVKTLHHADMHACMRRMRAGMTGPDCCALRMLGGRGKKGRDEDLYEFSRHTCARLWEHPCVLRACCRALW